MGHLAKVPDLHSDILDELEAAITLKTNIRVHLEDGSTKAGHPRDLSTSDHTDYLQIEDHLPIPVSKIVRVERV